MPFTSCATTIILQNTFVFNKKEDALLPRLPSSEVSKTTKAVACWPSTSSGYNQVRTKQKKSTHSFVFCFVVGRASRTDALLPDMQHVTPDGGGGASHLQVVSAVANEGYTTSTTYTTPPRTTYTTITPQAPLKPPLVFKNKNNNGFPITATYVDPMFRKRLCFSFHLYYSLSYVLLNSRHS
jgi:hypothetical protein